MRTRELLVAKGESIERQFAQKRQHSTTLALALAGEPQLEHRTVGEVQAGEQLAPVSVGQNGFHLTLLQLDDVDAHIGAIQADRVALQGVRAVEQATSAAKFHRSAPSGSIASLKSSSASSVRGCGRSDAAR